MDQLAVSRQVPERAHRVRERDERRPLRAIADVLPEERTRGESDACDGPAAQAAELEARRRAHGQRCAQALGLGLSVSSFSSVISSIAYRSPSRPEPELLTPP